MGLQGILSTVGSRIRKMRELYEISQQFLADTLKITRGATSISEWERGLYIPSDVVLKSISEEFFISLTWLTEGNGPIIDHIVNTGFASVLMQRFLDRTKCLLELHYSSNNKRTINHILELKNGLILLVCSDMNIDRKPRCMEVIELRNVFVKRGISIVHYKCNLDLITELKNNPSKKVLVELLKKATFNDPEHEYLEKCYKDIIYHSDEVTDRYVQPHNVDIRSNKNDIIDNNIYNLVKKAGEILESNSIYKTLLADNINALYLALDKDRTIEELEKRITILGKQEKK